MDSNSGGSRVILVGFIVAVFAFSMLVFRSVLILLVRRYGRAEFRSPKYRRPPHA